MRRQLSSIKIFSLKSRSTGTLSVESGPHAIEFHATHHTNAVTTTNFANVAQNDTQRGMRVFRAIFKGDVGIIDELVRGSATAELDSQLSELHELADVVLITPVKERSTLLEQKLITIGPKIRRLSREEAAIETWARVAH